MLADGAKDLMPVHVWKHDIEADQIKGLARGPGYPLRLPAQVARLQTQEPDQRETAAQQHQSTRGIIFND